MSEFIVEKKDQKIKPKNETLDFLKGGSEINPKSLNNLKATLSKTLIQEQVQFISETHSPSIFLFTF